MGKNRYREYFFDTEFIEHEGGIDLISIGIVCDDGREFYAEVTDDEIPWTEADDWVLANVRPHLDQSEKWLKKDLAYAILSFTAGASRKPRFWGWYADYDWVILARLFGRMVDIPANFPRFAMDLKQLSVQMGEPSLPEQTGTQHNALEDARWNKQVYDLLKGMADQGFTVQVG